MYLSHLVAGLAQPPALRVDTSTWTEAEWAAQAWLEEQEARVSTRVWEPPRCGCAACPMAGVDCRCLDHYHCGGCGCCDLHCRCDK